MVTAVDPVRGVSADRGQCAVYTHEWAGAEESGRDEEGRGHEEDEVSVVSYAVIWKVTVEV